MRKIWSCAENSDGGERERAVGEGVKGVGSKTEKGRLRKGEGVKVLARLLGEREREEEGKEENGERSQ